MKCALHSDLLRKMFLTSLLLWACFGAAGCGTTCVAGVWDGSGAKIGISNNTCPLAKATGAVTLRLSSTHHSASDLSSSSFPPQVIEHIFVALRGVQAHANVDARDASSGWQDLAPGLIAHPMQIDLLAQREDQFRSGLLAGAMAPTIIIADEYRQIRFLFLPDERFPTDALPEGNACGSAGWNCIIFSDGSVRPLVSGAGESEFGFLPITGNQSLFRVLPDGLTSLALEFDSASLVALRSGEAVRLISTFKVSPIFRFPIDNQTWNFVHDNLHQTSGVDP